MSNPHSISEIYDLIASDKLRQRTTGINQLREFLTQNTSSLTNHARKRILDLVFNLVLKERTAYILSQRKNEPSDAGIQRLSTAGDVVRLLISTGTTELRSKTCRLVLNHITDTLLTPTTQERLCIPLIDSYSKSFRMVVETPSHVEHLPAADIQTYLTFLCKSIDAIIESLGTSTDFQSSIYLFSEHKPSTSNQRRLPYAAAELLQSIHHLLNFSSGITVNQISDIWNTIGRFIHSTTESSTCDIYAISIANTILNLASSRDLEFCENVSLLVFEQLPELFKSKSTQVRENLLIFILYSYPFMTSIATRIDEAPQNIQDNLSSSISKMESLFIAETANNMNLLTSDIDINNQFPESTHEWFIQKHFHLKSTGNILAWITMISHHNMAVLQQIISFSSYASRSKKQKKKLSTASANSSTTEVISLEHHIFAGLISKIDASEPHLVRNIQAFIAHMHYSELPEFLAGNAFNVLSRVSNSIHAESSAWALLAISHLLHLFPNQGSFEISVLDSLWNFTCKRFYHPALSSIASFFLATMLSQNRMPVSVRKPRTERLLGMFDSSGPQISNGSIQLAKRLLVTYSLSIVDKVQPALEKLMFWLTSNWQFGQRPGEKLSVSSVNPAIISSFILDFFEIRFEYEEKPRYNGPFYLAFSRLAHTNRGLSYLKTGKVESHAEGNTKHTDQISTNASLELASNMLVSLSEMCERVHESLTESENALKFASYPVLYQQAINFIASLFLTACKVEQNDGKSSGGNLFQSQCRALTLKLQLLFKELCSLSNPIVLLDDHIRHILLGAQSFIEIHPHINESFYMEVYTQELADLLSILNRKADSSSSFDEDIADIADIVKSPQSIYLHTFDIVQSTRDVQLFMSYTTIKLLYSKSRNNIDFLEAVCKLFQEARDQNEIAAMAVTFISYLPRTTSENASVISNTLQRLVREIGERVLSFYEWDRAETIILFCIKLLQDYSHIWTTNSAIYTDCLDILNWLCKLNFEGGYKNFRVQTGLAHLLADIMKHKPELLINGNEEKSLPSCFGLLIADSPDIIYKCAELLPRVFKCYSITSHITFFNGIQDVLGRIYHQKETLAARCFLLTYLAQSSDSLLTGSVFNLLELAEFQDAELYLENGILEISYFFKEFNLQRFFYHQSEELLYLWYSNGIEKEFPFRYFGYLNKASFLADYQEVITVLLIHLKGGTSCYPLIREIADSTHAKSFESLLVTAMPRAWAYEFTSVENGTNSKNEFWLFKQFGNDKWKKCTKRSILVLISSLMLLVDFSVIPSSLMKNSNNNNIFSEIYSSFTPATLVSFPQPLIRPEKVLQLIQQVVFDMKIEDDFSDPSRFSYVLRAIINKIVQSVDPIQKCINLRRLLFFAGNYCGNKDGAISGYSFDIMIKIIVKLIPEQIVRVEAWRALQSLTEKSVSYLITVPDFFFKICLWSLDFIFKQKFDNQEGYQELDLGWLQRLSELILTGHLLHSLKTMLSWIGVNKTPYDSNEFVSTFKAMNHDSRIVMLNILAIELDSNLQLQKTLLYDWKDEYCDLLADIANVDPISTRGYTIWISRLIGKVYSSSGLALTSSSQQKQRNQLLTSEGDPIKLILSQISCLLEETNLEIVSYAEEVVRHLQANTHTFQKGLLLKTFATSLLDSMNYFQDQQNHHLKRYKMKEIADSGYDTTTWIFQICSTLLSDIVIEIPELECLQLLISNAPKFAKRSLPYIVHLYLKTCVTKTKSNPELDDMFNSCLRSKGNMEVNGIIIDTFFHLRANKLSKDRLGKRFIDVDIEAAVKSCLASDLPETALMLAEIDWSNSQLNDEQFHSFDLTLQIYEKVRDPDMYYAIPTNPSLTGAIKTFLYEQNHSRLLQYQSAFLNEDMITKEKLDINQWSLSETLQNTGMLGISKLVMDSMPPEDEKSLYSHAWKLQQWDLAYSVTPQTRDEIVFNLHKSLNSSGEISEGFYNAYKTTLELLRTAGRDKRETLYETLAIIQESESILNIEEKESAIKISEEQFDIGRKWMDISSFDCVQNILISRELSWQIVEQTKQVPGLWVLTSQIRGANMKYFSEVARVHQKVQHSINASVKLDRLLSSLIKQKEEYGNKFMNETHEAAIHKINFWCKLETAASNWLLGEQKLPITILKSLISDEESTKFNKMELPLIYSILVEWCSKARHETPEDIIDLYLIPARKILKAASMDAKRSADIFHTFAVFCDQQYNNPNTNEEISRVSAFREYKKKEMEGLSKLVESGSTQERQVAAYHLEKVKKMYSTDDTEYKRLQLSRRTFLENSAMFYLQAAIHADRNGEDISSFISLWLGNVMDKGLNKAIATLVVVVPSAQFVPWINQLSSRLGETEAAFAPNLETIILRVCKDHPYHSLYSIIGLRMVVGKQDEIVKQRCNAGNHIWKLLLKTTDLTSLLNNVETFSSQCVNLAHQKVPPEKKKTWNFDQVSARSWWLKTLPTLNFTPPTIRVPVRPDCKYDIPSIVSLNRDIGIASGLSAPKIVKCTADNGQTYTMLFKGGKDDLRQDAIMEQVFDQVNLFFSKNAETRSRNLSIRTYKVIPLGPTGGIIEFVKDTIPLMDYLQPAHKRYRPQDWDASKAREVMRKYQTKTTGEKYKAYLEIEKHIHPVLHMFFMDFFYSPEEWFTNRIRYIRSTAAISMLGYILGLGDRHCNNILLDTKSGEVVHIDLGISFDQGKLLRVPELIPFRLTRDLVDGMGISKTNGVFRQCCQLSLQVFRKESDNIATILNVLKYDPLYSWTISPLKRKKLQNEVQELHPRKPGESEAERALAVVNQKLSKTLNVEAVTSQLIQEATTPHNLSQIFFGWCPFY